MYICSFIMENKMYGFFGNIKKIKKNQLLKLKKKKMYKCVHMPGTYASPFVPASSSQ